MQLDHAAMVIRPRHAWEALDLGTRLAARYRGQLAALWLLTTLPAFAVLSALCWREPGMALLLFWWLKPLFERAPLYFLAQALFGQPPTLRQALCAWPGLLRRQWLASLTWHRLSPTRSFDLPVTQLEGLHAHARTRRLRLLRRTHGRAASALTLVGCHVETCLVLAALALGVMLLPQSEEGSWRWLQAVEWFAQLPAATQLWLGHLANLLYALALCLWGPVYVAGGFTLYLNRRTHLEGWDIELVLRALRARLLPVLGAIALVVATPLAMAPQAWAGATPRLASQPLDASRASQAINSIVAQPPFRRLEQHSHWQLKHPAGTAPAAPPSLAGAGPQWLAQWLGHALWVMLAGALLWLAWHYRQPFSQLPGRLRRAPPTARTVQVATPPEVLPEDIATTAEQLWPQAPRQALALLYRGLLARLASDYRLPLATAATEGEVLARVKTLQLAGLEDFTQTLGQHWQCAAYGHQLPSEATGLALCASWRRLFPLAQVAP